MAKQSSVLNIATRALSTVGKGVGIVFPLAIIYGILLTALDLVAYSMFGPKGGDVSGQQDLVGVLLAWTANALAVEIILGPLFVACAVYLGRAVTTGVKPGIYKAVNFALSRYSRMFVPHLAAQLSIQLGMIIVIPGVLFQMQYAFVDSVAALEDEAAPLNRSKRLTRGRRRSIFLLFLPWLLLSQLIVFADLWAMGQSELYLFGVKVAVFLIYFTMQVSFFLLYDERTRQRRARKNSEPAGAASDG